MNPIYKEHTEEIRSMCKTLTVMYKEFLKNKDKRNEELCLNAFKALLELAMNGENEK